MNKLKERNLLVGCPNVGDREYFDELVDGIFDRKWFTNNGVLVQGLESKLTEYLGVRHCIPVCNATVGLQVAGHALALKGEVILPAFTFVATPHSVQWEGLVPVFCDIDPETHLMDPSKVESLITSRTSAILAVHTWGRACYPEQLQKIADRNGLELYFDAAHAFGCSHAGQMIGNFGRCEVFSFHATKFFNTFEGGAIATNDDTLAAKIRLMINFGFAEVDSVKHLGTNGKMSEIHAAMGLSCFKALDQILATNIRHYEHYRCKLANLKGIRFCDYDDVEASNYQYIAIEVDEDEAGISRDALMARLHAQGIMVRRYFYPGCHQMEPYIAERKNAHISLPQTDAVSSKVLILPTGTGLCPLDVERVINTILCHVLGPSACLD
jgi:dTDP-4-amino-4,6-dideoxygalactose transaminase